MALKNLAREIKGLGEFREIFQLIELSNEENQLKRKKSTKQQNSERFKMGKSA